MKASDLPPKPPKIILYGPPGSGKTALAATLGADALLLDMDDGAWTLKTLNDKWKDDRGKVEVIQFLERDISKTAVAFNAARSFIYGISGRLKKVNEAFSEGGFPFKALIIDSLTSLGEAGVKYVMANSGQITGTPQIQHWGVAVNEINNVMGVIKELPLIVILIAHDEEKGAGKLGTDNYKEQTSIAVPTKKLIARIPRFYDEIWYANTRKREGKKAQFYLQTRSGQDRIARSRLGLPDETVFAEIDGEKSTMSLSMWELLEKTGFKKEMMK